MMMSRSKREHTVKQGTQMRAAWCGIGLSLSPSNKFGGRLAQPATIVDSRYIRN